MVFALLAAVFIPIAVMNHATPSPVGELVADAGGLLKPETEFALVDFQEPTAIWEMRRVVKGCGKSISESEVVSFLNLPGPRAVVLPALFGERIGEQSDSVWKVFYARGFNAAKGKFVDLTLVVKP